MLGKNAKKHENVANCLGSDTEEGFFISSDPLESSKGPQDVFWTLFDCCKQSLKWLYSPPSTHPGTCFLIAVSNPYLFSTNFIIQSQMLNFSCHF